MQDGATSRCYVVVAGSSVVDGSSTLVGSPGSGGESLEVMEHFRRSRSCFAATNNVAGGLAA
jgi:hypothetical protein